MFFFPLLSLIKESNKHKELYVKEQGKQLNKEKQKGKDIFEFCNHWEYSPTVRETVHQLIFSWYLIVYLPQKYSCSLRYFINIKSLVRLKLNST